MTQIYGAELVEGLGGVRVGATSAPGLHGVVEDLCRRAEIAESQLYVIPTEDINAFTTGEGRDASLIAVNAGLLQAATRDELEAVVGHEIGHIVHGDVQHKTRIALGCMGLKVAAGVAGSAVMHTIDDDDDLVTAGLKLVGGLAISAGASVAANLYTTSKNFEHEFKADAYSARLTGKPWALGSFFEKLQHSRAGGDMPAEMAQLYIVPPPSAALGVETHPPDAERIQRLAAMPVTVSPDTAVSMSGFCPNCGAHTAAGRLHCAKCGSAVDPALAAARSCPGCGGERALDAAFCTQCGGRYA